jgi:mannose-1-phosphate guanylyltransferase
MKTKAIILAGGVGSRFFPLSTPEKPKQFLPLFSEIPMIRETFERVLPIVPADDIYVITQKEFQTQVMEAIPMIKKENILLEPVGRNTAPAIGYACLELTKDDEDCVIMSLHSDHFIRKEARFLSILKTAAELAEQERIVTLGITPDYPETGYGYIEADEKTRESSPSTRIDYHKVAMFKEKPDFMTAQNYVMAGSYYWNAGIFIFKASQMLNEIKTYCPDLYDGLTGLKDKLSPQSRDAFEKSFSELPKVAVDNAVMEKSSHVWVIPSDIGWSDVGSYKTLYHLRQKNSSGNVSIGLPEQAVETADAKNNLIVQQGSQRKIGLVGVRNLMVVDTGDYLMVGDLDDCQSVKKLTE